jgi:hypothetical protein
MADKKTEPTDAERVGRAFTSSGTWPDDPTDQRVLAGLFAEGTVEQPEDLGPPPAQPGTQEDVKEG